MDKLETKARCYTIWLFIYNYIRNNKKKEYDPLWKHLLFNIHLSPIYLKGNVTHLFLFFTSLKHIKLGQIRSTEMNNYWYGLGYEESELGEAHK